VTAPLGLVIRQATLADSTALTDLWRQAGLSFVAGHVAGELASVLACHPGLVLVAEDQHGLAASVLGAYDGRRGWVNRLATRPDRRGEGLASCLLATVEERLAALGCRKINLLIEPDNGQAVPFYQRMGYTRDDLIFMEKWLPDGRGSATAPG
jgi:ribosomal protein S18 acetylase RimI-like enzyme